MLENCLNLSFTGFENDWLVAAVSNGEVSRVKSAEVLISAACLENIPLFDRGHVVQKCSTNNDTAVTILSSCLKDSELRHK